MAPDKIKVYLEVGAKRTFAGAVDWPGWCRSGRDEAAALQSLFDYGLRYAGVMERAEIQFQPPALVSSFDVVERLAGDTTTDFGAPGQAPSADAETVSEPDLARFHSLLQACWRALDASAQAAAGKELRRGPRGGGRDLEDILRHVRDAEGGYLSRLAWKLPKSDEADPQARLTQTRKAVLDALDSAVHNSLPAQGPRGGTYWTPRYFVRRVAWHALDHVWEIEDRVIEAD